ncbi:AbiV family abortive infection protein [Azospirillum brasilense]|uniref:AbiV family abortive infection protein n=1 Tax=Azospirillum brasilense TaxID=192 RepID=A0A560AZV1_AZOBR|nr:AbiV family abortive infection protein [Azospirillum brasilense]TWA65906.1 AbiV family abortive infection protein [Azospirillum brasilense]
MAANDDQSDGDSLGLVGIGILENAERLLQDAQLLRSHRRYPSATAIAVLSLEEVSKFASLNSGKLRYRPLSNPKDHKEKHRIAADMVGGNIMLDELREIEKSRGFKIDSDDDGDYVSIDTIMVRAFAYLADNGIDDELRRNLKRHKYIELVSKLFSGHFNDVKKQCFYVEPDTLPAAGPGGVDRLTADQTIRLAKASVVAARRGMRWPNRQKAQRKPQAKRR